MSSCGRHSLVSWTQKDILVSWSILWGTSKPRFPNIYLQAVKFCICTLRSNLIWAKGWGFEWDKSWTESGEHTFYFKKEEVWPVRGGGGGGGRNPGTLLCLGNVDCIAWIFSFFLKICFIAGTMYRVSTVLCIIRNGSTWARWGYKVSMCLKNEAACKWEESEKLWQVGDSL